MISHSRCIISLHVVVRAILTVITIPMWGSLNNFIAYVLVSIYCVLHECAEVSYRCVCLAVLVCVLYSVITLIDEGLFSGVQQMAEYTVVRL